MTTYISKMTNPPDVSPAESVYARLRVAWLLEVVVEIGHTILGPLPSSGRCFQCFSQYILSSLVSRDNVNFRIPSRLSLWCWKLDYHIVWLCCLLGCNPGPLLALLDGWLAVTQRDEMGSRDGVSKSQHFRVPLLQCIFKAEFLNLLSWDSTSKSNSETF